MKLMDTNQLTSDVVKIKPIFFSNKDMTEFSIKSIIWLPNTENKKNRIRDGKRKKKEKFKYKNMIQVYAEKLSEIEQEKLLSGDNQLLLEILSSLLNKSVNIDKNELTGKYLKNKGKAATFMIDSNNNREVFRGKLVAKDCQFQVIQDLRSWLIAIPTPDDNINLNNINLESCKRS